MAWERRSGVRVREWVRVGRRMLGWRCIELVLGEWEFWNWGLDWDWWG